MSKRVKTARGAAEAGQDADHLLEYVLGLTEQAPVLAELEIDPDRVRGHLERFLAARGLRLSAVAPDAAAYQLETLRCRLRVAEMLDRIGSAE